MTAYYFKTWAGNSSCIHVNLEWIRNKKFNIELILLKDKIDYSKCINTLNNKKDN